MSDPIKDYARAVAEVVFETWAPALVRDTCDRIKLSADLDAIIASVPAPEAQRHDAPTCGMRDERWWLLQSKIWDAINRYAVSCGGDPSDHVYGNTPRQTAAEVSAVLREFVLPPDTTTPAPDVQALIDTAVPAERERVVAIFVEEFQRLHEAAIRARSGKNTTTPAPDVQAQPLCDAEGCARTPVSHLCAEHHDKGAELHAEELDAAVAREREAIVATLQEHGEYYLAGIVEDRARSAKGA